MLNILNFLEYMLSISTIDKPFMDFSANSIDSHLNQLIPHCVLSLTTGCMASSQLGHLS